ncbi:MAG: cobalamin-binding protein [Firmicutes bacterium]|nr:cobalamin-binding protein [Bacillota bacterium]
MQEVFALFKPSVDAHTLGLDSMASLLEDCGYRVRIGPDRIARALDQIQYEAKRRLIITWLKNSGAVQVGLSYRLDPIQAVRLLGYLVAGLKQNKLLSYQGGLIRGIYFAGLPKACALAKEEHRGLVRTFQGGESVRETLQKLNIPEERFPAGVLESSSYDDWRLDFGRELVASDSYRSFRPFRPSYPNYGTKDDSLEKRLAAHRRQSPFRPLMRAHVGPYSASAGRRESVREFFSWARDLAQAGFLDILSIGTSQLTQSNFGEDWGEKPNGGGVPINSAQEYREAWEHSRPLLLRTYAGTKNISELARLHEEALNICWHALSFWWFNQLDGRGPYHLLENLREHVRAAAVIAEMGKPLEANVPHHFAFRGADDVTYVVAAYLGAKLAKKMGIRTFIFQNMLNTPRSTWGVQDLAKSRAALALLRQLEDPHFKVLLQPRAGLDYFRPDLKEAKAQLAAVTALMDDLDPWDEFSPPLIHVVSYSEGVHLATPPVINESIQITQQALKEYRELRKKGEIEDMDKNPGVQERQAELVQTAGQVISALEKQVPRLYSAEGFYKIFVAGFLPTPYLWNQAEEYRQARKWRTKPHRGGIILVDQTGRPVDVETRINDALGRLKFAEYALAQRM